MAGHRDSASQPFTGTSLGIDLASPAWQRVVTAPEVALVYPAFTLAGYAAIRSLGEAGVPVVALNPWSHPHMRSRWALGVRSPNMVDAPEQFFAFVSAIASACQGRVALFMMEDVYVYLTHQHRQDMPANVVFPWMSEAALAASLDKKEMFDAAERGGVPLPATFYPENLAALKALRSELAFPCLLKPLVSRFSFGGRGDAGKIEAFPRTFGGKCARADSFEELEALFSKAEGLGIPVCVQELLVGPIDEIIGVHLYADANSRVLGAAAGRKLRQVPGDFGTGTFCEAIRDDESIRLATALVEAIGYHGIGGVEFKRDRRDGSLRLIEINPRGVHWMGLACVAGVDLPYMKFADLMGRPFEQQQTDFSVRWLDGAGDRKYMRTYVGTPESPYHVPLAKWAASLPGARPAVLNWRDPVPGLLGFVPEQIGGAYLRLKESLTRRTTAPSA